MKKQLLYETTMAITSPLTIIWLLAIFFTHYPFPSYPYYMFATGIILIAINAKLHEVSSLKDYFYVVFTLVWFIHAMISIASFMILWVTP